MKKRIEVKMFYEIREIKTDCLYAVWAENFKNGILPFAYKTEQDYRIEKKMFVDESNKTYTESAINNFRNSKIEVIITNKEAE